MSYIPDTKEDTPIIDNSLMDGLETGFYIDKFIGAGGGGTVFRAKVTKKIDSLSLYSGMDVAIKICNPDLSYWGCEKMKEELANTSMFSSLNYRKLCYNYPIAYGFFHRCIFFNKEDVRFILNYIKDNNIEEGRDAFIIYCTTPPNIEIDNDIIKYLFDKYSGDKSEFLMKSAEIFPKTDNAEGLYLLSKRKSSYINWDSNDSLFDYLDYLQDLKCDMFLLLQYLNGKDLSELRDIFDTKSKKTFESKTKKSKTKKSKTKTRKRRYFKFTNNLFFESIYSTICSIAVLNIVPREVQESNAMVINVDNPRIYLYKDSYYIIEGDMFYWIDFQVINREMVISKDLIHFKHLFTKEQRSIVNSMFADSDYPSVETVLDILFRWLWTTKIPILNKKEAQKYMIVNYNYKMINVDELLSFSIEV